jgi:hypothetical protein
MIRQSMIALGVLCLLIGMACNFAIPGTIPISQPTPAAQHQSGPTATAIIVPTTAAAPAPGGTPTATPVAGPSVTVAIPVALPTDTPTLEPSQTQTASVTPTPFVEPAGCKRPPDDYARVIVNGAALNARTLWMLKYARSLYQGTIDFAGRAITQGSFNPGGVTASFGTHDGGGAVDLSVRDPRTGAVLRNEIPAAIRALRIAGFAAWLREVDELYDGSPIHIHAIAIGDAQLSPAARDQLTGPFGYFRGYNGLPKKDNVPVPDRHGGPIFCQWMLDMGYRDLR